MSVGTGLVVIVSRQAHLTRVSLLAAAGHQARYPASYPRTPGRRTRRAVSVSCCLSAAGVRFSGHPVPAGELGLPHGRLTALSQRRTLSGFPRSTLTRFDRVGCLLYPGDGGAHPGPDAVPGQRLPLHNGESLHSATASHHGATIHEASTKVHAIHPSGLPLARDPRMGREVLRLSPRASHPAVTSNARQGRGQASSTRPELRRRPHVGPPNCESTRKVRPRVATA